MTKSAYALLLHATRILNNRTIGELVHITGIPQNRIRAINGGRVLPSASEAKTLLGAAGFIAPVTPAIGTAGAYTGTVWEECVKALQGTPQAMNTHTVQALGRLIATWCLDDRTPVTSAPKPKLVIDYLTLTANCDKAKLGRLLDANGKVFAPQNSADHEVDCGYRTLKTIGLIKVYSDPRKSRNRFLRLEVNPAKMVKADFRMMKRLLKLSELGASRVTRVDVAVDLPCSMSSVQMIPSSRVDENMAAFWSGYGIETFYFGKDPLGPTATNKIRIYDAKDKGYGPSTPWTRFEQENRNPGWQIGKLAKLPNLFSKFDILPLTTAPDSSLIVRLLTGHAHLHGIAAVRRAVPSKMFDKLNRQWASQPCEVPHPKAVFEKSYAKLARKFLKKIGVDDV